MTPISGVIYLMQIVPLMEAEGMGCVQLILMIVGIIYLIRRPKYTRLSPEDYPHLPAEIFHRWRRLEVA